MTDMKKSNIKKAILSFIILQLFFNVSRIRIFAQDTNFTKTKLQLVADLVLKETTFSFIDKNSEEKYSSTLDIPVGSNLIIESRYNDWRYWNGVLNIAMIELAKVLDNVKYKKFAVKNIQFVFDNFEYFKGKYKNQNKWEYPFGQKFIIEELDDCGAMGASVAEVYKMDQQQRYKDYLDLAAEHILNKQTRLEDGTFVRAFPLEWTLWADDLYMGISFLARMGELTNSEKYFDDAINQVINFHNYVTDQNTGLMYHCWYSDINKTNVALWGRANGWVLLAEADLLDKLPANHPKRNEIINILQDQILNLAKYQSPTGLWHQLLDKADSYLETSCSAIFTYVIARAVNKNYIDERYFSISQKGWEGVMSKIKDDGKIENVCTGTVVSNNLVDYYNRPAPLNDVHGIGFILLAGKEILNYNTQK